MTFPEGSTAERHAIETTRIAQVFGLTGGELADTVWTSNDAKGQPVLSHWWYEGVPEWTEQDYANSDGTYRTMVRDCLFGLPPASLTDEHGTWTFICAYRSTGETECSHEWDGAPAPADCAGCEGDGFIYIGDGWHEVIYKLDPDDHGPGCDGPLNCTCDGPEDDDPCPCGVSHTRAEHSYDPDDDERDPDDDR